MSVLREKEQGILADRRLLFGIEGSSWVMLVLNTGIQAVFSCIITAVGILAPFLVMDLGLSQTMIGLAGGAVSFGNTFTALLSGRIADKKGVKKVMIFGSVMTVAFIIAASATSIFPLFIALLVFTGLWSSVPVPAGSKSVTQWFPPSRLGFALGFRATGVPLGGFIGALFLPYIAINWGWRMGLFFAGVLLLIMALIFQLFYREYPEEKSVDKAGKEKAAGEWDFVRNGQIWICLISAFVFIGTQFTMVTYLTLYICSQLGLDVEIGSRFIAVAQMGGVIARIVLGIVSDTLFKGARKPFIFLEGLIMLISIVFLLSFTPQTPLWLVTIVSFFFGASAMGWNAILIALIMKLAPKEQGGTVVGFYLTVMQVGVVFCPILFGFLADLSGSYQLSWKTLFCFILAATLLILTVKEPKYVADGKL